MTTYAVSQPRRGDGLIPRLIIVILLLILAFLVYDRYGGLLTKAPVSSPAPANLPAGWLGYTERTDAYQADPAVIEARRAYMIEARMGCETLNRVVVAPGVERVRCGSEQ